jgi:predicted NodU family carbamoyl transferase
VAFLTAPTRRAAILTTDGVGEWATLAVGHGERKPDGNTEIRLLREIRFPHSLGMLYSTFTAYLGFAVNEDEYKVMGLAGYSRSSFATYSISAVPTDKPGQEAECLSPSFSFGVLNIGTKLERLVMARTLI